MPVRHNVADHELLTVEAIARLADRVPAASVEHNRGDLPAVVESTEAVERLDSSPGEIARNIETNGAWMVIKNIEQLVEYRALLDEMLDEVLPLVSGREGGMNLREGFIFLSAANSTTPAHTDHEHNFLLQIRGSKQMNIGRFSDSGVRQRHLEKMYAGDRNMTSLPENPTAYELAPGDGVYVPPYAPHWVVNGPAVSVSLSITFRTPVTERFAGVHALNTHLRRLRLSPRPPGEHSGIDRAKFAVHRSMQSLRRR